MATTLTAPDARPEDLPAEPALGRGMPGTRLRRRNWRSRVVTLGGIGFVVALLAVPNLALAKVDPHLSARPVKDPWYRIQHVIVVMMENHAYDNFFGDYCLTVSPFCNSTAAGLPATTCIPYNVLKPSTGCVRPFNFTASDLSSRDLPHDYVPSHQAYDNGSMDGFIQAEGNRLTMGTYNGSMIPVYWDVAQQFGLGDRFFSSVLTYSLPNHWYLIAGKAPSFLQTQKLLPQSGKQGLRQAHLYLNQSNATTTVEQELHGHSQVSWKYYDWPLANYSTAINTLDRAANGSAYSTWNPLAAKSQSYQHRAPSHFANRTALFTDLANGALPNVSWVIPYVSFSDHAPSNLTNGENWISTIVNSVETSPDWNRTALFVTWDDYGGYYDHVAPPAIDAWGLGFRTPLLVVSPWTSPGLVVHHQLEFESLLGFIEDRWGLGCLDYRDCFASLPTAFFNWSVHRSPVLFGNATTATYPYTPVPASRGYKEAISNFEGGSGDLLNTTEED